MEFNMERIGARIRAGRNKMGLSQEKLGRRVHLSSSYISRLELGKQKNITLETLAYIARSVEMPLKELMFGPDDAPDPQVEILLPDDPHYQECVEILRMADLLDETKRAFFFQVLWGILHTLLQEGPIFACEKVKQ